YFLMLLSAALINSAAFAASEKPNILFIFLDDFGWKDTSYMGSDFYESPNIDKLASEGMVFTKAYSASANCAPARACMLSGQYTPRHEIYNVGTGLRGNPKHSRLKHIPGVDTLDTSIRTWAQQIQASGYKTAMMGKWHLSDDPIPYGFDVNVGGTHSGSPPRGYYPPHPNIPSLQGLPEDSYLTDYLSDQADAFIRSNKDNPWMLYLTHFAVHTPLDAKKELVAKYEAKAKGELHDHVEMATMIQSVDDGIGKIQATLDELGLTDNTIVLFFSDNGGYGPATDMDPLKGYKGTYYEGGIRVPFFVKWPGVVAPGQKSSEPIIGVDVFPTLCEMTGAALPNGQDLDGVSLVSLFKGETPNLGNRALYWHFPAYLQSYAVTDEQRDILFRSRPCSVIRVGDWKLHQYFEDGGLELYNLRDDIGETRNLAKSMNEKTSELLARLEGWREGIGAPVPNERNPQFDAFAEAEGLRGRVKTRK
ncbi:MAG: sulfatase, partial [Opitutales bacterium]|nr:sulfatase [Opitutales bacterium]